MDDMSYFGVFRVCIQKMVIGLSIQVCLKYGRRAGQCLIKQSMCVHAETLLDIEISKSGSTGNDRECEHLQELKVGIF